MNPENLIQTLNNECKHLCQEQFVIDKYQHNIYKIRGQYDALNRFDFPEERVKVIHWFADFWLFLEMKFITEDKKIRNKKFSETYTCISLSIFQGKETEEKLQLFRAEWDDYNNPEEKHPQPHWHITSNQAIEKTLKECANNFETYNFISLLEDEQQIVKWLQGVLNHLRAELDA